MAITPLKLFHAVASTPEATVYTSPGGVVLRKLLVVNTSGAGALASVSVAGKRVLASKSVATGDFFALVLGVPLADGDTVTALTSVAGALTVLGTGWSY